MSLLKVETLAKTFGVIRAVDSVSFEVRISSLTERRYSKAAPGNRSGFSLPSLDRCAILVAFSFQRFYLGPV